MRPHYQPRTVRLCSSIMTSRCTCLSAMARSSPHTGTQVRLNIAGLPLCLSPLPHAAPFCRTTPNYPPSPPPINTPLFSTSNLEQTRFSGQAGPEQLHYPSLISSPFYRNTMTLVGRNNKQGSIGTREVAIKHYPV